MPSSPPSDHTLIYGAPGGPQISAYAFEQLKSSPSQLRGIDDVLTAAAREAEEIRERARAAGEAEGRAQGLELARAELGTALAALAQAAEVVHGAAGELLDRLERDAVDLALRLAEQIIQGQVAADPTTIVSVARTALRRVADRRHVTVVVNPADLEVLSAAAPELQRELGGIEHID